MRAIFAKVIFNDAANYVFTLQDHSSHIRATRCLAPNHFASNLSPAKIGGVSITALAISKTITSRASKRLSSRAYRSVISRRLHCFECILQGCAAVSVNCAARKLVKNYLVAVNKDTAQNAAVFVAQVVRVEVARI